nr:hypothetical protein B0A51_00927 [Rachicladosporium sp. CCFEE 5018]
MASDTASTLTGEPDNLTELHRESGLQTAHDKRHTKTGFLVQGDLLAKYMPTPLTKRPKSSWIWKDKQGIVHGEAIIEKGTKEPLWLCKACYNSTPKLVFTCVARPTTSAQRHMELAHGYELDGTRKRKREQTAEGNIAKMLKAQSDAQSLIIDRDEWQFSYLQWIVADDVSLRRAVSEPHRRLPA